MKITLDHNCIIHLIQSTDIGLKLKSVMTGTSNEFFIVNIGASEMRERGIKPENYGLFVELLIQAKIDHLQRLNPLKIFDLTFWDICVWGDENDIELSHKIGSILFGNSPDYDAEKEAANLSKKWINHMCDEQTIWCHIKNKNDIFVTTDNNFMKLTKLPELIKLGAGDICHPNQLKERLR